MKTNAEIKGHSLIGGEPCLSDGATFSAVNPATGEALTPAFHAATPADVARACELAGKAFAEYGRLPGKKRAAFLRQIAAGIEQLGEPLVARATAETALPPARIESERARTCHQLRMFANLAEDGSWADPRIDHGDPARKPQPKPDVRSMLRPLGPVVVFGASNFPLAFSAAGGDTAAALAAGCPVIVKAHSAHPGTSELVGRAICEAAKDCGMPAGVFSVMFGSGQEIGQALIRDPRIKAGTFTGSRSAGTTLAKIAAERPEPIPFFAEMSSVNPVFLLPGIVRAKAAEIALGLHASLTLGVGQFCTNPGLIFLVDDEPSRQLLSLLTDHIAKTPPGTMLTAGIRKSYEQQVTAHSRVASLHKASRPPGATEGNPNQVAAALLLTNGRDFRAQPLLAEEIFGPCGLVILCASTGEFKEIAASLEGQLTATIWGASEELLANAALVAQLERKAGRLIVNGFPTGVEVCPAMVHGGPYPATTDGRFSSVGTRSIFRFVRPVAYQNFPMELLPPVLRSVDPLRLDAKWMGT